MLAYRIEIDGGEPFVVGQEDWTVLVFSLTAGRVPRSPDKHDGNLHYSVSGMTLPDTDGVQHHFRWGMHDLTVGSRVTVTIVDAPVCDPPAQRFVHEPGLFPQRIVLTDEEKADVWKKTLSEADLSKISYETYLALKERFEPAAS